MLRYVSVFTLALSATLALSSCQAGRSTNEPPPGGQQVGSQPRAPATNSPTATKSADTTTQGSSDVPRRTSESELFPKLLDGQVAGATLTPVDEINRGPLSQISNPHFDSDEYDITPAGCDRTGIEGLAVWADGTTASDTIRLALGTGTSSPEKYEGYLGRCAENTTTVSGGQPVAERLTKLPTPSIEGATGIVAVERISAVEGSEFNGSSYLITGNVGTTNIVLISSATSEENGDEPSFESTMEIFKTQVDKLKN